MDLSRANARGWRSAPLTYALLALFVAAFLLPVVSVYQATVDEGTYLDGAARILGGALPYRDFFEPAGPVRSTGLLLVPLFRDQLLHGPFAFATNRDSAGDPRVCDLETRPGEKASTLPLSCWSPRCP
jgi:hypothetical protein